MRKEYQKSYREKNKERIIIRQKKYYQNNKEHLIKKQRQYYSLNSEKLKKQISQYGQSPNGIYVQLKKRAKKKNLNICNKEEFINWHNNQSKKCIYCEILEILLKELEWGPNRYWNRLTIDRKDNKKGYTLDNICLACIICNRIKNTFWTSKETKIMAQRELKSLWQKQL